MTLTHPLLHWCDGQPVSARFGDVYFSRSSGIEETQHVYLSGNQLQARWAYLPRAQFTIAETGFGTGLNFLCAWRLWRQIAPTEARLHFVSVEKNPLTPADLARALSLWPELQEFSAALLARYHMLTPGWRRIEFDAGRVALTLLLGDVSEMLPQLRAQVDAWFLDGFSPAKNPDMWQPAVFSEMARLAASGCTFATFTSAGMVRRGLEAAGFQVEKERGFGSKRDMLRGSCPASQPQATARSRVAAVIGGGLAGCATARSLAKRGWQVCLIERHQSLAAEASGNPQGVLYPRLSGHDIALSRIAQLGFMTTLDWLENTLPKGVAWDDCGLLQQAFNARERKRCQEVLARGLADDLAQALDSQQATERCGLEMPHGGLWFPRGGWVDPPAFCHALADSPRITQIHGEAEQLLRHGDQWHVIGAGRTLATAAVVVVCGANESLRFKDTAHLPLEPVRGQITQIASTARSKKLRAVVCAEGYISPERQGLHCLGATFTPQQRDTRLAAQDHAHNLAMLNTLSPGLYQALEAATADLSTLPGRAATRCVAPDYLPLAGPLLDAALTLERYPPGSRLADAHLPWLGGLFINCGHGSKGLLSAPLCAELIAALLAGEPLPMDAALARALDPNRFLLRERGLKRLLGAAIG